MAYGWWKCTLFALFFLNLPRLRLRLSSMETQLKFGKLMWHLKPVFLLVLHKARACMHEAWFHPSSVTIKLASFLTELRWHLINLTAFSSHYQQATAAVHGTRYIYTVHGTFTWFVLKQRFAGCAAVHHGRQFTQSSAVGSRLGFDVTACVPTRHI